MLKAITVAKWEFLERIKNKGYIFMTFIFPLLIFGITFIPAFLSREDIKSVKVIGIIEKNISISSELENSLSEYKTADGQPAFILRKLSFENKDLTSTLDYANKLILEKAIEGYLYIEKVTQDSFVTEYHTEKVTAIREISILEKTLSKSLVKERLKPFAINHNLIEHITKPASLQLVKVTEKGKEDVETEKIFLGTFFFILFLMMSLIMSAGLLVRSVVEEKSNRIIEILISSCSTNDLMAGKILGLSALGLTQILVWIAVAISIGGPVIFSYIQMQDLVFTILYFILGYILYASLFIGLGSIGNTEQESQTIMSVLSIVLILPIILSGQIFENPESKLGEYISYFPLTTAPMMMMRINLIKVEMIEKLLTIFILVASIFISIWFSGKIFRVAILSYGKTPNISEIIKWLKSK